MIRNMFIRNGLQFECIGCGNCCRTHGEFAYIYLAPKDVVTIAQKLNLTAEVFTKQYCATDKDGELHLAKTTGDCTFLNKDGRCDIYDCRPKQCETWPFCIENLNPESWQGPVKAICPGIDQGRLYTAEEIHTIAMEREDWYDWEVPNVFDQK